MIPEGYMFLEEFGELFHKKLDDCYAMDGGFSHRRKLCDG